MHPPFSMRVVERHRFEEARTKLRLAELVLPARLATDGQEKDRVIGTNKERRVVRQRSAMRQRHVGCVARASAEVQLNAQTQRSTAASNEFEKTKLQLARVMGLPLGQAFSLDANLPDLPVADLPLDEAVNAAYQARPDYQAALERVRAAESARRAIVGEALPSLNVNADYGDIGLSPLQARLRNKRLEL